MKDAKDIAKRASAGAVMGGALMFSGGMGLAAAQPPTPSPPPAVQNDGLVDVKIADAVILQDADLGTAALVVAQICDVGMIPPFLEPVDQTGNAQETCRIEPVGPVTVAQNNPDDAAAPAPEGTTETSPAPTGEPTTTQTTPETTTQTAPEPPPQEAPDGQGN